MAGGREDRGIVSLEYHGKIFEGAYEVRDDTLQVSFGSHNKLAAYDGACDARAVARQVLGSMVVEAGY